MKVKKTYPESERVQTLTTPLDRESVGRNKSWLGSQKCFQASEGRDLVFLVASFCKAVWFSPAAQV